MVPFGEQDQDPELTMLLWKWRWEVNSNTSYPSRPLAGWIVGQNLLTCHPIRGVNRPGRAPDENDAVDQWWSEVYGGQAIHSRAAPGSGRGVLRA